MAVTVRDVLSSFTSCIRRCVVVVVVVVVAMSSQVS
jgi:hypothetical protein